MAALLPADRRRLAPLAAVVALLAAGCASTVQATGGVTTVAQQGLAGAATAPQGDSGLSAPAAEPATAAAGGPVAALGVPTTGSSAAAGAAVSAPGVAASSGTRATTSAVKQGVGVTAKAIYVGITYTTNGDAANAAIGASGITSGDEKADAQAVVDDINAHGGMAGRKVIPVYYAYDANSTAPYANQDQAACAAFTQDHHVFAVTGAGYTDDFTTCLEKAGALDIDQGEIIYPDETFFRQNPAYFNVGTLSQDRMMAAEVASLQRQNYFSGWNAATGQPGPGAAKIGIITYDVPEWERPLQHVLLPALARAGHRVSPADIYRVPDPAGTSDTARIAAGIQSAALRFRQDGVTHVLIFDTTGGATLFFAQGTRSQHYYPRLGVNSGTAIEALYGQGLISANQLNGAVGLGWEPSIDLPAAAGNRYATPATKYCLAVMKKRTGQTYDSTNAASLALGYCDQLYVLRDALAHIGPVINQSTGIAALEAIGSSFTAADLPAFYLSPSHHDSARFGYDMRWSPSCGCVQYVGAAHVIP